MKISLAVVGRLFFKILIVYLLYALLLAVIPYAFQKSVGDEYRDYFSTLNFSGQPSPDRVALVESPEDAFLYRIRLLQSAEHSMDIAYHTIGKGITSEYFFGEMLRAANRGVKIRFLVDGKMGGMSGSHSPFSYALFSHPNIEFKIYNPLGLLTPWKWNSLLHDKFIIIDDKFLLLGGRNVGDNYFNPAGHEGRLTFDQDVLVFNTSFGTKLSHESVITQLTSYMNDLMNSDASKPAFHVLSATKRAYAAGIQQQLILQVEDYEKENPALYELPTLKEYLALTVPTQGITLLHNPIHIGVKEPRVAYGIAQLALQAEESVLIQTPYATGNKKILSVMNALGDKDIEFELLTNSIGSSPNFPAFSNYHSQRKKFLKTGATIYEFQERDGFPRGSVHAKTYLFDDHLSAVGSLNMDDRSLYLSTETMLVINSPEYQEILLESLANWKADSLIVGEDNSYLENPQVPQKEAPLVKRFLMSFVSIFSRLFQFLI